MNENSITITLICSVVSAIVAWYSAMNTSKKNAENEASKMTQLKTQLEFIVDSVTKIQTDLSESLKDRRAISNELVIVKTEIAAIKERVELLEEKTR